MNILKVLMLAKSTRYGAFMMAGILIGSWLGNQYPAETEKFWGQPVVGLALALAGLWSGRLATNDWKDKVEEALNTEPPNRVKEDRP